MIKLGLGTSCSVSGNPPSSSILDLENMFSHPELISLKNCPISTQQTHNWMTLRHGKMNKTNRKIPTFCGSSFIKIHQARYLPFPIIDPPTFTPFWISAEAKAKWALGIQMVDGNNEGWVVKIVIWMMCAVYIYIYIWSYIRTCAYIYSYITYKKLLIMILNITIRQSIMMKFFKVSYWVTKWYHEELGGQNLYILILGTPLKINMEHVLMEVWIRSFSFLFMGDLL